MTIQTMRWGAGHVAHLDGITGDGLLVLPPRSQDVRGLGVHTLHAAEWDAVMGDLWRLGWEPSEGEEDGELCREGWAEDGREVVGLLGLSPIMEAVPMEASVAAWHELRQAAGLG